MLIRREYCSNSRDLSSIQRQENKLKEKDFFLSMFFLISYSLVF